MTRDRICFLILLSSVSVLLHTSHWHHIERYTNKLLSCFDLLLGWRWILGKINYFFPLWQKNTYILTIMNLKVDFLVWVEVWEFLPFYFIYYTYMNVFVYASGAPAPLPLSWSPHLYSDLTPLLSRISPSSPSIPSLNFIGSATFLWTLRCVFRLVLRTDKRLN